MGNVTEEKWIEMLEKKSDGNYIAKYPKVKSKSGVTFDEHLAESTQQAHLAKNIGLEDIEGNFVATNVEGAMNELFTNVSNGKNLVGGAITDVDDSVVIPTDPTFVDLANAIRQISTGKKWANGSTSFTTTDRKISVRSLDFRAGVIVLSYYNTGYGIYRAIYSYSPSIPYKILRYDDYVYPNENLSLFDDGFEAEVIFSGTGTSRTVSWMAIEK